MCTWGPWEGLEGRHLPGQQAGPWPSDTLDPSFPSFGVMAQGAGLDTRPLEKPQQVPLGVQVPVQLTAGEEGHSQISQIMGAVSCHHGCPQSTQPRVITLGSWLILEPFWASASASVKEGRHP